MSKAKRRLKNFDFSGDNAHVALVHKEQGGPANGTPALILKSTDIVVEMSMAEFLVRFFGIWSGDAEFIANLLGYSDDTKSLYDNDELMSKVSLLKRVKEESEDSELTDLSDFSDVDQKTLREITKSLATNNGIHIKDLDVIKDADGVSNSPVSENQETPEEVVKNMSVEDNVEMIEKSAVESMIEKAVKTALADKDSEIEELRKSLKEFEEEKLKAKREQFVVKAKDFEILGVEDTESFGELLMKMSEQEDFAVIESVLQKAVNIAKNADGFNEQGHDAEADIHQSGVEAVLKARGSIRS